jgi:hypothetical protein
MRDIFGTVFRGDSNMELKGTGKVRQFNKSLYILIPADVAQDMKITKDKKYNLFDGGKKLVADFNPIVVGAQ